MRLYTSCLLSLIALLAGCASTTYVSRDYVFRGGTAQLGDGREAVIIEQCRLKAPADAKLQEELRKNPDKAECAEMMAQVALGTNVVRDIAAGAVPVTLGAITQGEYAKSTVREQARVCKDGKCGGPAAAAGSTAGANVVVNIGNCAATNSCLKGD